MPVNYLFDRLAAFASLLILWPVLAVLALLIRIKMPGGPILFVQERVGRNRRFPWQGSRGLPRWEQSSANTYWTDIKMILATVFGWHLEYGGETI